MTNQLANVCPTCSGLGSVQAEVTAGSCVDIDGQWWHDPWSPSCNRCSNPCPDCGPTIGSEGADRG
jgi:hypothetical protein